LESRERRKKEQYKRLKERMLTENRKERKPTRCGRVRGHKRVIERLIGERRGKEREECLGWKTRKVVQFTFKGAQA
jgi:hypothetical protein